MKKRKSGKNVGPRRNGGLNLVKFSSNDLEGGNKAFNNALG